MSKAKGKQKKPQNYEALQKEYEEQRRELLDVTFTLRKMEERVNLLSTENHRLQQEREDQFHLLTEKIEELTIKNETNEKRLITMRNDLTNAQVENKKLNNTLSLLQKNMSDERIEKTKEYQQLKKTCAFQIAKYENMLTDYKLYMSERDNRQKEISELVEQREIEIANRIRDVADKEREKVQATDKIRDQMGNKIREMRQNLLSLKKEELQTTTRLTMLQNHQLTSQLEYQSKQTEKIVFKNEELQASIVQLRQQLEIHKQVEDQLAKRSHFSKGIIKKLHARVTELQEELKQAQQASVSNIKDTPSLNKTQKQEKSMVGTIQKQLEKTEKKYAELYTRFEALHREKEDLNSKYQTEVSSKGKILNILMRASQNLRVDKENGTCFKVNLTELKQKNIKEWSFEEVNAVMEIMLAACRPALTKQELSRQAFHRVVVFQSDKNSLLPKLSTEREKLKHCASENRLVGCTEDMSKLAKDQLSKEKYSVNIASKMVIGKVREWGRPLTKSRGNLQRKYKLSNTFRN